MKTTTFLSLFSVSAIALLGACQKQPEGARNAHISPETLMNVSVEQMVIPLDSAAGVENLISQLNQQQPSQAVLQCAGNDMLCKNARKALEQFGVPSVEQPGNGGNQVVLAYEQLITQECDPKFVDNSINPNNLSHPSFGCAASSNMVQMVNDKRQFTNPAILGKTDGSKAAQNYSEYSKPTEAGKKTEFLLEDVKASGN